LIRAVDRLPIAELYSLVKWLPAESVTVRQTSGMPSGDELIEALAHITYGQLTAFIAANTPKSKRRKPKPLVTRNKAAQAAEAAPKTAQDWVRALTPH